MRFLFSYLRRRSQDRALRARFLESEAYFMAIAKRSAARRAQGR